MSEQLSPYWAEIIMFLREAHKDADEIANAAARMPIRGINAGRLITEAQLVIEVLIERAERRAGIKP